MSLVFSSSRSYSLSVLSDVTLLKAYVSVHFSLLLYYKVVLKVFDDDVRFVFVVKSKISLSTAFFFCFFSRKRLLVSTHVSYIHMRSQKKKKKKKRVSVVVSVSAVVLSSEESFSLLCRRFVSIDR